jgi:hypothetical protein
VYQSPKPEQVILAAKSFEKIGVSLADILFPISMPMYVMHIGHVGMSMFYLPMRMEMSMGLTRRF